MAVRKGVGSNPTLVINFCCFPLGIHFGVHGSTGVIVGWSCFVCACETWGEPAVSKSMLSRKLLFSSLVLRARWMAELVPF